jgi:type IV pilus assembly protein PilQ
MAKLTGYVRLAGRGLMLSALLLVSCQHYEERAKPAPRPPAKTAAKPAKPKASKPKPAQATPAKPPPVTYSLTHDEQVKEILDLASKGNWELAETRAQALYALDPQDPAAARLRDWVRKRREQIRERALEDRIRALDAKDSVFNPTPRSLTGEKKDRGLPPRKDVRDAVQQIEGTPYIPDTFGKTNILAETGLLFDFESRQGRMAKILEREISVHMDNSTLESIIFKVGEAEGLNFVADRALPAFQAKLSINMNRAKLSEFLNYVARNLDVQFQVGEDLIWVVDAKDKTKIQEETRYYRLRKGFILPASFGPSEVIRTTTIQGPNQTITEQQKINRFVNDLAPTLPAIERAITNFFQGKYNIDLERNFIIARGTRDQLDVLERIIKEFDQPIQQVLIEARFVTVSQGALLRLGVIWNSSGTATIAPEPSTDRTGLKPGFPVAGPFVWNWTNVFGVSDLTATLIALQQSGESQQLSAPRLTVLNNLPATIEDGLVQYYYEEYQVKTTVVDRASVSQLVPAGKPTKITGGATLNVLASIGADGKTILLALNPKVNSDVIMSPFMTISDVNSSGTVVSSTVLHLPQYRTQDLATRCAVRSGGTIALGGVLERQQMTYVESVPILGNLPILGALFRRRTEMDSPRYLLIFVTATILAETGEYLTYSEEANPDTRRSSDNADRSPTADLK